MRSLCQRGSKAYRATAGLTALLLASTGMSTTLSAAPTATPIKHVIVIIGENRSFDQVFATYKPVNKGDTILNLLSQKIVKEDGTPGPNYGAAVQYKAFNFKTYQLNPPKTPYTTLPPALAGGPSTPFGCQILGITTGTDCNTPANVAAILAFEKDLSPDYQQYLLTGGTGQKSGTPDTRISYNGNDASNLPPGPFQLTSKTLPYDSYTASPVHRFFQMWQQLDCNAATVDKSNGFGCQSDLFPWVEVTQGAGQNGAAQPAGFNDETTGEGSTSMGFFNVQQGDAPYFKSLADNYTLSDNYHQAVNGGTGANHVMLGTGDAVWFSDGNGNPQIPPVHPLNPQAPGTPATGYTDSLQQIENPNPQPGTNNWWIQDGYGGGTGSPTATSPNANYGGGSYVNCADPSQPGVSAIIDYLNALNNKISTRCENGHYYLVNNYNPGYFGDGSNAFKDTNADNTVFTVPPSSVPTIGELLNAHNVSWSYFGGGWNEYLTDKYLQNAKAPYCNICNFEQYATAIMANPAERKKHLKDTSDLHAGIAKGELPDVSFVKPDGLLDGHPSSSKLILFEGFVKKIVDEVQGNQKLWKDTAILITVDEGGGYWDSGYVQPVDFFGDGTRIPLLVVSKFSTGGRISHSYTDHVSIAKFIEANWGLPTISNRSRDNLPNPLTRSNPYIPANSPAIGDLMDAFNFNN